LLYWTVVLRVLRVKRHVCSHVEWGFVLKMCECYRASTDLRLCCHLQTTRCMLHKYAVLGKLIFESFLQHWHQKYCWTLMSGSLFGCSGWSNILKAPQCLHFSGNHHTNGVIIVLNINNCTHSHLHAIWTADKVKNAMHLVQNSEFQNWPPFNSWIGIWIELNWLCPRGSWIWIGMTGSGIKFLAIQRNSTQSHNRKNVLNLT